MPRQARKKAASGIYHIMLRGIDRQMIFEDSEDYLRFLDIVRESRDLDQFKLFAYCLMGNHIHLLIQVADGNLETIFKRIGGRFVYYYNVKYKRTGPLFQDRFKSEPVEDDAYFLTVLRYIHQNPVKAKMCKNVGDYPYSSYTAYLHRDELVDAEFALGMIDLEAFVAFNSQPNSDKCLELTVPTRQAVTDQQAKAIIERYAHCQSVVAFQSIEPKKKEQYIKKIYEKGVSIRQISRLTGTSKGLVEKYLKN